MTQVLLVTCSALPEGEHGAEALDAALASRGVGSRWVAWDDPVVDWSSGLVAVRSTWDYDVRREEFLAWAGSVPWMLNSAAAFAWNTDKGYLVELARAGVPVVPTISVESEEDLPSAIAEFGAAVVKPRVGAGGRGVAIFDGSERSADLGVGPWVVQPLVESVRTEGETSVFVLDGQVVSQAQKRPGAGEIRVHEEYGGSTLAVPVTGEAAELGRHACAAAESILGGRLDYARVDQMRLADGTLAVSELEATEPGLYLDVLPGNAEPFARLVSARLEEGSRH